MNYAEQNDEHYRNENLKKLIAGLKALPDDYDSFNMYSYQRHAYTDDYVTKKDIYHGCGTFACILGHGPTFGIPPQREESWHSYGYRILALSFDDLDDRLIFDWCFSQYWPNDISQGIVRLTMLLNGKYDTEIYPDVIDDITYGAWKQDVFDYNKKYSI